ASAQDHAAMLTGHLQAVDNQQGLDVHIQPAAAQAEHIVEMRLLKEQLPGQLVVLLVESAAGDQDANRIGVHVLTYSAARRVADGRWSRNGGLTAVSQPADKRSRERFR